METSLHHLDVDDLLTALLDRVLDVLFPVMPPLPSCCSTRTPTNLTRRRARGIEERSVKAFGFPSERVLPAGSQLNTNLWRSIELMRRR